MLAEKDVSLEEGSVDTRVLHDEVREGLLRGVRADVALRHFGAYFAVPHGSLAGMTAEDFAMSRVVDGLDDFISHDWQTGRWPKFLALCLIYNGDAAVFASCATAVLVCTMMNGPVAVLPKTLSFNLSGGRGAGTPEYHGAPLGLLLSGLMFWLTLLFGQRFRSLLCGCPRIVFLDRLCINQLDEEEKSEGITSLAGFMRHSDRLIVLWTPRYFTRLWCVYEMATWLHLGKDIAASVHFMPVCFALSLLAMNVAVSAAFLLNAVISLSTVPAVKQLGVAASIVAAAAVSPWFVHVLRGLAAEMQKLDCQLRDFSIRDVRCFCCEQGHAHPATSSRLRCDRALVHRSLWARFEAARGEAATVQEALEDFDRLIKTGFRDALSVAHGSIIVQYNRALLMSVPAAWQAADICASMDGFGSASLSVRHVLCCASLLLCVLPSILKVQVLVAVLSSRRYGQPGRRATELCISLAVSAVAPLGISLLWVPLLLCLSLPSAGPQLCVLLAHVALTLLCFWRRPRSALKALVKAAWRTPLAGSQGVRSGAAAATENFN